MQRLPVRHSVDLSDEALHVVVDPVDVVEVVSVVDVVDFGAVVDVEVDAPGFVVAVDADVVVSSLAESTVSGTATALGAPSTNCCGGSGNVSAGTSVSAAAMNLRQIVAGSVPPVTVTPCTCSIGRLPSGYPIHTTAA